jgi:hypothetical protein
MWWSRRRQHAVATTTESELRSARVTRCLHHLACQKDNFESSVFGTAYRVHRGVWGGVRIKNGYERCFCVMEMIEAGDGVLQTTENIKTMKTGPVDET